MAKSDRLSAVLVMIFGLLTGCSSESFTIPETGNGTLDTLLQAAPAVRVNLDAIPPETLLVREENALGRTTASTLDSAVHLGSNRDILKVGNHLYVADSQQLCIWEMNMEGEWTRKIGREGRGPGEFGSLLVMDVNSEHVYVPDLNNGRITVFDHDFNYENGISGIPVRSDGFVVTDRYLYLAEPWSPKSGGLIQVRDLNRPDENPENILSQIIPFAKQPAAFNTYEMGVNSEGQSAIGFSGLPYILLLDSSHRQILNLYLDSSLFRESENPSPVPVNGKKNTRVRKHLRHLFYLDNRSLLFFVGNKLYKLVFEETAGSYRVDGRWFFTYGEADKREESPNGITVTSMEVSEDTVYLGSQFEEHIYRFELK